MLGQWDEAIFRWINGGWSTPILDGVFWLFSLGIKTWPVRIGSLIFAGALILAKQTRVAAIVSVAAAAVSNGMCDLVKYAYFGARPAATISDINVMGAALTSSGTVSAHSANMAAVATVFWLVAGKRWGLVWCLVAFLTGISRVYVGAHYPSQVVFGWALGAAVGAMAAGVFKLFFRKSDPRVE